MGILVAAFVVIFSHFRGLKILPFKPSIISSKNTEQEKMQMFGAKSDGDDDTVMVLQKPSPPDMNPTPRRSKRGTPDGIFGTLHHVQ